MNAQATSHRHFHDELSELKVALLSMSGEAQAALGAAVEAVLQRDGAKASEVILGDKDVDQLELDVEETVIRLLATQQPMARDLRFLTAAMKISNDLERVGDHAVNIAQSAERLLASRPIVPEPELLEMARQARMMLADALDAFVRGDSEPGQLNPLAIAAMAEQQVDIASQRAKGLADVPLGDIDTIVTLCAEEICPVVPGQVSRLHWPLPDPKDLPSFRAVRDELRRRLPALWGHGAPL